MKTTKAFFDLGGSGIKYAIENIENFSSVKIEKISKNYVLKFISEIANKELIEEIFISAPGVINSLTGKVGGMSAIENWASDNFFNDLLFFLENKETKIFIDNDGNCALLGNIHQYNKKVHSALSVVIGTGIGGAVYSNEQIQKGISNSIGEFGAARLFDNPKENISTRLSTNALCKKIEKELGILLNGVQVFEEYEKKNFKICEIVDKWIKDFGILIHNLIWFFDPQVIFIGGAISSNKVFQKKLVDEVDLLFADVEIKRPIEIEFSTGGNKMNLLGAALLSK